MLVGCATLQSSQTNIRHGMSNEVMKQPLETFQVPEGYALVSIDALKLWGKYDLVSEACQYPITPQLKLKQDEKSELEKDAASLLFALQDAWPYVHARCTINSVKNNIQKLLRKHGDFAEIHKEIEVKLKEKINEY